MMAEAIFLIVYHLPRYLLSNEISRQQNILLRNAGSAHYLKTETGNRKQVRLPHRRFRFHDQSVGIVSVSHRSEPSTDEVRFKGSKKLISEAKTSK